MSLTRQTVLWPLIFASAVCGAGEKTFQEEQDYLKSLGDMVMSYPTHLLPGITALKSCDTFRVMSVYANGEDMLFLDEVKPDKAANESTNRVTRVMSFAEFNTYHSDVSIDRFSCKSTGPTSLLITGTADYINDGMHNRYQFEIHVDTKLWRYRYKDDRP